MTDESHRAFKARHRTVAENKKRSKNRKRNKIAAESRRKNRK